jgi:arginine deiminase
MRFLGGALPERMEAEHHQMVQALRGAGAEVLELVEVLDGAVVEARRAKVLETWLRGWAPQLAPEHQRVTGAVLLGAADEFVYRSNPEGLFAPLTDPVSSFYWTRDSAVMTPRGVMLCRFSNEARWVESTLARFAYEWSPALRRYPIVFDAAEEQLAMEGGDFLVADEKTLWMGVGNRSQEAAARRIARKLNLDVVTVQLPSGAKTSVHSLFLHLDTVCTFVDSRTVLTLPYLFEKAYSGSDPLTRMLRGLSQNPKAVAADIERLAAPLREMGKIRRYRAGSGEADTSIGDMKLVDWLRAEGYQVLFVGGTPPGADVEKHMAEVVLAELRHQASNVFAVGPRRIVAYDGNTSTLAALRQGGIESLTFPGTELMRQNGGPHCLTQPLERRKA